MAINPINVVNVPLQLDDGVRFHVNRAINTDRTQLTAHFLNQIQMKTIQMKYQTQKCYQTSRSIVSSPTFDTIMADGISL